MPCVGLTLRFLSRVAWGISEVLEYLAAFVDSLGEPSFSQLLVLLSTLATVWKIAEVWGWWTHVVHHWRLFWW
jgi:hypothetical protein